MVKDATAEPPAKSKEGGGGVMDEEESKWDFCTFGILFTDSDKITPSVVAYIQNRVTNAEGTAAVKVKYSEQNKDKPRWIMVRLDDKEIMMAKEKKLTSAQAVERLNEILSGICVDDKLIKELPDYHGEQGPEHSLLKACMGEGVIDSFFPIHDGKTVLACWRSKNWSLISPPIDEIRAYFGDREAFYFAWVSHYCKMALVPGVIGTVIWLFSRVFEVTIDENPVAPLFGIFVAIWANLYLKLWTRQAAELSWGWGSFNAEKQEKVRPEFKGELRVSPVTGLEERYFPYQRRLMQYGISLLVTLPLILVVVLVMFTLLNLQGYITDPASPFIVPALADLAAPGELFDPAGPYALVPVVGYSVVVMFLNKWYRSVAEWLTAMENHRTDSSHQDALVIKRVIFEMFDCYSALLYVAFYKLDIIRLREEVLALFTADEIRRVALESLVPFLIGWFSNLGKRKETADKLKKDEDSSGLVDPEEDAGKDFNEDFDDYLELVVQFGYISLFATACPLAAMLAVLSNIIEMRSDLFKLCFVTRREPNHSHSNIPHSWLTVLSFVAYASVLTNCLIIGCTSHQMRAWFPSLFDEEAKRLSMQALCDPEDEPCLREAAQDAALMPVAPGKGDNLMSYIFFSEHLLLIICFVLRSAINNVPKAVKHGYKRKKFLESHPNLA